MIHTCHIRRPVKVGAYRHKTTDCPHPKYDRRWIDT